MQIVYHLLYTPMEYIKTRSYIAASTMIIVMKSMSIVRWSYANMPTSPSGMIRYIFRFFLEKRSNLQSCISLPIVYNGPMLIVEAVATYIIIYFFQRQRDPCFKICRPPKKITLHLQKQNWAASSGLHKPTYCTHLTTIATALSSLFNF